MLSMRPHIRQRLLLKKIFSFHHLIDVGCSPTNSVNSHEYSNDDCNQNSNDNCDNRYGNTCSYPPNIAAAATTTLRFSNNRA